jgi:hypothetical protein
MEPFLAGEHRNEFLNTFDSRIARHSFYPRLRPHGGQPESADAIQKTLQCVDDFCRQSRNRGDVWSNWCVRASQFCGRTRISGGYLTEYVCRRPRCEGCSAPCLRGNRKSCARSPVIYATRASPTPTRGHDCCSQKSTVWRSISSWIQEGIRSRTSQNRSFRRSIVHSPSKRAIASVSRLYRCVSVASCFRPSRVIL